MKKLSNQPSLQISLNLNTIQYIKNVVLHNMLFFVLIFLGSLSMASFLVYYLNGFGLAYNDARSHLDMGRRIVEGLKPGLAQLGSVWLPLPHLLMLPTVWNDFMWHSGLSGAIQSMVAYMVTGLIICIFLRRIGVGVCGILTGLLVFALNPNILYLQSTAMTELLLLVTMTAGVYELAMWHKEQTLTRLIKTAVWIMLATLIRYDGWFLFLSSCGLIAFYSYRKYGFKTAKGIVIFFSTLAGFGIVLWLLWNQLIFKDVLSFALGPYSAHAQQKIVENQGDLATKGNLFYSIKIYFYAMTYTSNAFVMFISILGGIIFWFDKRVEKPIRIGSLALLSPLIFNIIALYFGYSVLIIEGMSGHSWFNPRYGVMMLPSIAIFTGYFVSRISNLKLVLIGLLIFVTIFSFTNLDAVTLEDATYGLSTINLGEAGIWLHDTAVNNEGFILVSTAAHDPLVFSSGLPMTRFITEGTGQYWDKAVAQPDKWARWIVMRTTDNYDLTHKLVAQSGQLDRYHLVNKFAFADVYELNPEYLSELNTKPIIGRQL